MPRRSHQFRNVLARAAREAVSLYVEPLARLSRRRIKADYRDIAARDLLRELHELTASIVEGRVAGPSVIAVRDVLAAAESSLSSEFAASLELRRLGRNVAELNSKPSGELWNATSVHAAFVSGYLAGILRSEILPSTLIKMGEAFFDVHSALVAINRKLRFNTVSDVA